MTTREILSNSFNININKQSQPSIVVKEVISNNFKIDINKQEYIPNESPVISNITVNNISVSGTFTLSYVVTDKENDTLTHSININNNGYVSITPTKNQNIYQYKVTGLPTGRNYIYVQVSDGTNTTTSDKIEVVIPFDTTIITQALKLYTEKLTLLRSAMQAVQNKISQNQSNAVKEYAKSEIKQLADSIQLKVEKNGVISSINQTAEAIKINASKVNLEGYTTFTNLSTPGQTIVDGGNIKTDTLSVNALKSNNDNPIIKLFPNSNGYCSIDATKQFESGGKGTYVRLKWDKKNYFYVGENAAGIYLGRNDSNAEGGEYDTYFWISTSHARIKPNKFMIGSGSCRIDTTGNAIRLYRTYDDSGDFGLRLNSTCGRLDVNSDDLTMTTTSGTTKTVSFTDHTHNKIGSNKHCVESSDGCVYLKAGSSTIRLDDGTNQTSSYGGSWKLVPTTSGVDLGSGTSSWTRWRNIFAQNALNTSDIKYKENIQYLDSEISLSDTRNSNTQFLDFIKNEFKPATYMYKAMRDEEGHTEVDRQIGFIANDIIDSDVGKTFLYNFGTEEETDIMFSPTGYTTVVAKALQEEIKKREELETKCADLEDRLAKLEHLIKCM